MQSTTRNRKRRWGRRGAVVGVSVVFLAWVVGFVLSLRFVHYGGASFERLVPSPLGRNPVRRQVGWSPRFSWEAVDGYWSFGAVQVDTSRGKADFVGTRFPGLPPWSQIMRERLSTLIDSGVTEAREVAVGWPMRVVVFEYWGKRSYNQAGDCYIMMFAPPVHTRLWWPGIFGTLACLGVAALVGWLVGVVVFTVRNRVDRARLRADLCPRCRYPRPEHANNAGSVCPECGWVYKARETEIGYGE